MRSYALSLTAAVFVALQSHLFALAGWTDNYDKALAQAKTENKKVLLNFTGSDWCPWCVKMDKDVLTQAKFKDYAKQNYVLVEVDFPQTKKLPKHVQEQNEKLKGQFDIGGFPTFILLDSDGKQVGKVTGYVEGGPDAFISQLEGKK